MLFGIVSVYRVTKIRLEHEVTSKSSSCVFMFLELRDMLGKSLLSLLLISIPVARNKPAHIPSIELDGIGESSVAFESK
ncbi:hypothetical protein PCANC_24962 [Puccinia coronata f. sp. avenae]|uniref:Uncharacterized protein n=1 Tax=Puccinia coronata f. sp. avenae TaxID=200324 RepID=A0A2N5S339_9BASI|nr:hypothetical protein PCANC_24962 [Puccinia coronata f. sp. avenae]